MEYVKLSESHFSTKKMKEMLEEKTHLLLKTNQMKKCQRSDSKKKYNII